MKRETKLVTFDNEQLNNEGNYLMFFSDENELNHISFVSYLLYKLSILFKTINSSLIPHILDILTGKSLVLFTEKKVTFLKVDKKTELILQMLLLKIEFH